MNMICCIKQVPDTTDVKIDPETNTLIRSGVEAIANRMTWSRRGGADFERTVRGELPRSHGPAPGGASAQEAISLGADEAILLLTASRALTRCHQLRLARAVERLARSGPIDLVLCARQ
jgi:electron transfer flavoprotein beta subunit